MDGNDIAQLVLMIGLIVLALWVASYVIYYFFNFISKILYIMYRVISTPFFFTNWLQRQLSKPWRIFLHNNIKSEGFKKVLRGFFGILKVPLYVLLAPLRFINALFFNICGHALFETFNYLFEFSNPTNNKKGFRRFLSWLIYLPWRFLKYICWHIPLTWIESIIWTIIDTFIPALTLYHGTKMDYSKNIVAEPGRVMPKEKMMGQWYVGGGNWAGDGIYFAPAYSTAEHYSYSGVIIIARVTLGKVLDMGLAPRNIYDCCGGNNPQKVTQFGLKHNYTTGEWWRKEKNWWEYVLYDPGNRYNHVWRIRPLYIINPDKMDGLIRVEGGMVHWLFRKIVIKDIIDSIVN